MNLSRFFAVAALALVSGGFAGIIVDTPISVPSNATVEVINVGDSIGSGVAIKPGYVLTANHVVNGAKSVKVMRSDGQTVDATILWQDENHDVAAVGFSPEFKTHTSVLACDYKPRIGDRIEAVGQPTGLLFVHTFGRIAALGNTVPDDEMKEFPWPDYFLADLTINPGNSGGPVYASENGLVVGIATGERVIHEQVQIRVPGGGAVSTPMVTSVPTNLAFVVPSRTLCAAVEAHKTDDLSSVITRELRDLKKKATESAKKGKSDKSDHPTVGPNDLNIPADEPSCKMATVATVVGKANELKRNLVKYEGQEYASFVQAVLTVMPKTSPDTFNNYDSAYIADVDSSAPDKKLIFFGKDGCIVNFAMVPTELAVRIEAAAKQASK